MSRGELKVSERGWPALQSTRSVARSPKWASLNFRSPPSEGSCRVTMVEPTGFSYLESMGPYRCLRDGYGILVCRLRLFACRVLHLRSPSPSSVTSSISGVEYKCELEPLWLAADLVERAQMGRVHIRSYENGLVREGRLRTLRAGKRKHSQM